MRDVIRLLPDSVANQIAAGEVIQRPASVIKELVENAVDAGATDIRIYIKDAGRTLIQVIDNGCGMSAIDARMAFERHATSKINRADDLFRLHTMGFRGEALPSICAISQVDVRTRLKDANIGTRLIINGNKFENQEPCMCEPGTTMSVRNLFFNVPVRRKFLKSDNVELSNIMREFERLALVNNNIHMSIDTGTRNLDLRPATFHQRIHDLWKNNLKMQLLPVEVDTQLVRIHGFVSRPEFARRRNALQFLIVNGRNMRHPYFHKAVLSSFEGLIAADTQPCYFLKFEVDPASIDINIHPTKNEIKFEFENEIWPLIVGGVKASLGKNAAVPSIDFTADVVPVAPVREDDPADTPEVEVPADYNPFALDNMTDFGVSFRQSNPRSPAGNSGANLRNWDRLYEDFMRQTPPAPLPPEEASLPEMDEKLPALPNICLQFLLKFIITTTREGILIIDQHRAHVKVLFEHYMEMVRSREGVSQKLVFPEEITLTSGQQAALKEVGEELRHLGFDLEYKDEDKWDLIALPPDLQGCDPRDVILRILDSVMEDSPTYGREDSPVDNMRAKVALVMARSSAITRGRPLSGEEMENLVAELFSTPDPVFTPSGNRVYALLDEATLRRLLP